MAPWKGQTNVAMDALFLSDAVKIQERICLPLSAGGKWEGELFLYTILPILDFNCKLSFHFPNVRLHCLI